MSHTEITVYLNGTSKDYRVQLPLDKVMKIWETGENLLAPLKNGYAYIRKDQCPIVEFCEVVGE